ncbi:UNKNOWN [Stylonychia lemnae]|uniref:Cadg domain containing protein n=1 Tax=Stylonychia lemnae TaxID=5949 RepID=A0A078A5G0_STYLE|nr:UNKNOWN [Stylonychia lemnae]|eukprot:CDW77409.1 UNKNOWN [Stylonychia lemnae]
MVLKPFQLLVACVITILLKQQLVCQQSTGFTTYDGITQDQLPSYYTTAGINGIKALLNNRNANNLGLNYFIRMWIRPNNNFNSSSDKTPEVLLDIDKSLRCQLQYQNTIACFKSGSTSQDDFIYLTRMNYTSRMWLHVAIAGSLQGGSLQDFTRPTNFATLVSLTSTVLPTWSYENAPNDICYAQFGGVAQLPSLDNQQTSYTSIDSRMKTTLLQFQYSTSIWMRIRQNQTTSTSFSTSTFITQLRGVFSVWMSGTNLMRIRVHASTDSNSKDTNAFYVPYNEWFNLQFTIDQKTGYDIRVYNIFKRLITSDKQTVSYSGQTVAQQIQVFNNFRGQLKSIIIYQALRTLPLVSPSVPNQAIQDDNLIVYYNLDQSNFNGNNQFKSIARTLSGTSGANLLVNTVPNQGSLVFDTVPFDEIFNYNDVQIYGQLNQTESYYDGISCINTKQSIKLVGNTSQISIQQQITSNLSSATIELWFKRPIRTQKLNFLASIFSQTQNVSYFQLYQLSDQSNLICQVFQNSSASTIQNDLLNQSTYFQWQHIACFYRSRIDVFSIMHSQENLEQIKSVALLPNESSVMLSGNYTIILGNNREYNKGSEDISMREFRFWQVARTLNQIRQNLLSQLDPSINNGILSYYRLNSGDMNIQNLQTIRSQISNNTGLQFYQETNPILSCPLNTYLSPSKQCQRNPFTNQSLKLLTYYNASENSIKWMITPIYSMMHDEFTNTQSFIYTWYSNNRSLTTYITNQVRLNQLSNQFVITYATLYNSSNTDNTTVNNLVQVFVHTQNYIRSFVQATAIQYRLDQCRYLVDKGTGDPIINKTYSQLRGQSNLEFDFSVKNVINCSTDLTQSISNITILQVTPLIALTSTNVTYDETDKSFTLLISKEDQLKFKLYQIYNFIIGVQVQQNGQIVQESTLNIIYRIRFVEKINSVIMPSRFYPQVGDNLILNGSLSKYELASQTPVNYTGIDFKWICPAIFQQYCQNQTTFKILNISGLAYNLSGAVAYQPYTFILELSSQIDPYQNSVFSSNTTITYVPDEIPNFSLFQQDKDKVYVLEDNTFKIDILNYKENRQDLTIIWEILPIVNFTFIEISDDRTTMTIKQGGLNVTTSYDISVNITFNVKVNSKSSRTLSFKTGYGNLTNGTYNVTPQVGFAQKTLFNFSLTNFFTDYEPITYRIYGTQFKFSEIFEITPSAQQYSKNFSTLLPELYRFEIRVNDSKGNQITQGQLLQVEVVVDPGDTGLDEDPNLETQQLINLFNDIQAQSSIIEGFDYTTTLVNRNVLDQKLKFIGQIYEITNGFVEGYQNQDNLKNRIYVQRTMNVLKMLTNNTIQMNNTIATMAFDILIDLQLKDSSLRNSFSKSDFSSDYLHVISSLDKYTLEKLQFIIMGRLRRSLFYNTMSFQDYLDFDNVVTQEKQKFENFYCDKISQYERQYQIPSFSYNLMIDKFQSDSTVQSRSYNSSSEDIMMQIQIDQVIQSMKDNNQNWVNQFCLIGNSVRLSPFLNRVIGNQTINSESFGYITILDNLGLRTLETINISQSQNAASSSILQLSFPYDYLQKKKEFRNNQTVCMQIKADKQIYKDELWSAETCQTQYQVLEKLIVCKCSSIMNSYYGIVTDFSRKLVVDEVDQIIFSGSKTVNEFSLWMIIMLAFLGIFLFIFPLLLLCLDKIDYRRVTNFYYNLESNLIKKVAKRRYKPIEIVTYRQQQFKKYTYLKDLGCGTLFGLFYTDIHPLFWLFSRFDIIYKRVIRLTLCCLQVFTVAIIPLVVFKYAYESDQFPDDIDSQDTLLPAIYLGLVTSLLLLPIPRVFYYCMRTRFEVDHKSRNSSARNQSNRPLNQTQNGLTENVEDLNNGPVTIENYGGSDIANPTIHDDNLISQKNRNDKFSSTQKIKKLDLQNLQRPSGQRLMYTTGDDKKLSKTPRSVFTSNQMEFDRVDAVMKPNNGQHMISKNNLKRANGRISERNERYFDIYQQVAISDEASNLRGLFIALSFIYCIAVLVILIMECQKIPKQYQFQIMISFGTALFIGWFILNPIRIAIVSCLVQSVISKKSKDKSKQSFGSKLTSCLFVNKDAQSMMKDILIIKAHQVISLDFDNGKSTQYNAKEIDLQFEKKGIDNALDNSFHIKTPRGKMQQQSPIIADPASPPSRRFKEQPETGTQANFHPSTRDYFTQRQNVQYEYDEESQRDQSNRQLQRGLSGSRFLDQLPSVRDNMEDESEVKPSEESSQMPEKEGYYSSNKNKTSIPVSLKSLEVKNLGDVRQNSSVKHSTNKSNHLIDQLREITEDSHIMDSSSNHNSSHSEIRLNSQPPLPTTKQNRDVPKANMNEIKRQTAQKLDFENEPEISIEQISNEFSQSNMTKSHIMNADLSQQHYLNQRHLDPFENDEYSHRNLEQEYGEEQHHSHQEISDEVSFNEDLERDEFEDS